MKKNTTKRWKRKYTFGYYLVAPIFRRIIKKQYGFKTPKIDIPEGPCLVLCNHVTTYDPMLVMAAIKKPIHAVAAKDFVLMKYRKVVTYFFDPIWKDKSLTDPSVPLSVLRCLGKGESVLLFPEGNRTFSSRLCYIGEEMAKLAKMGKTTIVYINLIGGFTIDPRFSLDYRKGEMEIRVRGILKKEDLEKMSIQEVHADILKNLTIEELPPKAPSISSKRAEKLERVLYRCPVCHELNHIRSEGNLVKCDACGLEVTYGENLTFENPNKEEFHHHELFDWYKEQEEYVRTTSFKDDEVIYDEPDVNLEDIDLDHQVTLLEHVGIKMTPTQFLIGDKTYPLDEIKEIAVSGKQTFLFYYKKITYRVSSFILGWNPLKYMHMFYHLRNKKLGEPDTFLGI